MRRWAERALLLGGGTAAGWLIMELILAAFGMSFPNFYQPDRYCGTALRPGAEGWYTEEGRGYVRINSDGLRDREHPIEKPPNTLRIAVLGDSYAEAFHVAREQTFWAVLERELRKDDRLNGMQVEVINFGVSGYGTGLELLTLRNRVWKYAPDIVLLAFLTGNDVSDNSYLLNHEERIPYFYHQDHHLVLDTSYLAWYRSRQRPIAKCYYWLLKHSRVLRLFKEARYAMDRRVRLEHQQEIARKAGLEEAGMSDMIYMPPNDPLWKEAWQVTEDLLALMRKDTAEKRARFLVVTLSNPVQVHPNRTTREEAMRHLGVPDLFYPDRRIRTVGEREGFPVLNLAPVLQAYAEERQVFFHGFDTHPGVGHWNSEGHAQAGRLIAHWIAGLLVETPMTPEFRKGT